MAKATYEVKRIILKSNMTENEYWDKVKNATVKYCNGVDELTDYCGGKLHRQRGGGYSGINGNIEYIAIRIR